MLSEAFGAIPSDVNPLFHCFAILHILAVTN